MRLSNKGRYGVEALFDIAFFSEGKPAQMKAIAERQSIPPRFLEQILQDLKKAGLVRGKRGPHGGYTLAKRPDQIRIGDVVRALEGDIQLCGKAEVKKRSVPEAALAELEHQITACLNRVTLEDLCRRGRSRPSRPRSYVYSI